MIQSAIAELNDGKGSSQEAISAFLRREHKNLPVGHDSFLSHHLRKLCRNNEIKSVNNGRYILVEKDYSLEEVSEPSKRRRHRRGKQTNQTGVKKMEDKESIPERENGKAIRDPEKKLNQMAERKPEASGKPDGGIATAINFTCNDKGYCSKMDKLKDTVFEYYSATNPSKSVTPEYKSHAEQRLLELFPNFDTPIHSSYAIMIQKATQELSKEGQLNEEAISAYIKRDFKGLPIGHESFLHLRLKQLSRNRNQVHANKDQCMFLDKSGGMKKKLNMNKQFGDRDRSLLAKQSELPGEEILSQRQETGEQTKPEGLPAEVNEQSDRSERQKPELNEQEGEARSASMKGDSKGLPFGRKIFLRLRMQKFLRNKNLVHSSEDQCVLLDKSSYMKMKQNICRQFRDQDRGWLAKQHGLSGEETLTQKQETWEQTKAKGLLTEVNEEPDEVEKQKSELNVQIAKATEVSDVDEELRREISRRKRQRKRQKFELIEMHNTVKEHIDVMEVQKEEQRQKIKISKQQKVVTVAAPQLRQPKMSGRKMAAELCSLQMSDSPGLCIDTGQHLHISTIDLTSAVVSSRADPHQHYEQQQPNRRRKGRPLKGKRRVNSEPNSNGQGWNGQRVQQKCEGQDRYPGLNSVADYALALSLLKRS